METQRLGAHSPPLRRSPLKLRFRKEVDECGVMSPDDHHKVDVEDWVSIAEDVLSRGMITCTLSESLMSLGSVKSRNSTNSPPSKRVTTESR